MRTEREVLELFDRANPVPDLELLDPTDVSGQRYLAAINARSSEMDNDNNGATPNRFGLMAIAAAVIVIAGIAWAVLAQGDNEVPPATDSTTTTTTITTSTTEATTTTSAPTTSTEPEAAGPGLGPNGFELFRGQEEPGRYETDNLFRTMVFDSDGAWACVHTNEQQVPTPCGSHEDVSEAKRRGISAAFFIFAEDSRSPGEIEASLRADSDLIVSDAEAFDPTTPDANWTSVSLTIEPAPGVGTVESHCGVGVGNPDAPCALSDLLEGDMTEAIHGGPGVVDWIVSSPQSVWLMTLADGTTVVAVAYFQGGYVPPAEDLPVLYEAMDDLVASVVFP